MSICKIGETKVINGKRYRKEYIKQGCEGCHLLHGRFCEIPGVSYYDSIEDGGCECSGSIWILADDQPEAPTATPPRDEVREQRRFEAAVAAMQGMLDVNHVQELTPEGIASWSVRYADSLLAELDRTGAGK